MNSAVSMSSWSDAEYHFKDEDSKVYSNVSTDTRNSLDGWLDSSQGSEEQNNERNLVENRLGCFRSTTFCITNFFQRAMKNVKDNRGAIMLLFSQFFGSIMNTTVKLLSTKSEDVDPIDPIQILFTRMLITYLCCVAYMLIDKRIPQAPFGARPIRKLLCLRGIVGFIAIVGSYYSLQYLSLSDAIAISFSIPMVTGIFAWIFLGERYTRTEAICGIFALCGVVMIAKPSFLFGDALTQTSNNEAIESPNSNKRLISTGAGVVGVIGGAFVYIVLRKIGHAAHPLLSISYYSLLSVILTLFAFVFIPDVRFAIPRSARQWFLLTIIGLFGFLLQLLLTFGVQRVKASKAALLNYTNILFSLLWDFTIWKHLPGPLSICGTFLILGSAIYAMRSKTDNESCDSSQESTVTDDNFTNDSDVELRERDSKDVTGSSSTEVC